MKNFVPLSGSGMEVETFLRVCRPVSLIICTLCVIVFVLLSEIFFMKVTGLLALGVHLISPGWRLLACLK